jgi:hypothetical protein
MMRTRHKTVTAAASTAVSTICDRTRRLARSGCELHSKRFTVQLAQQCGSRYGSRTKAMASAKLAARTYHDHTSTASIPISGDRAVANTRWTSTGTARLAAACPLERTIAGPPIHPSQTGANHSSAATTASTPRPLRRRAATVATPAAKIASPANPKHQASAAE